MDKLISALLLLAPFVLLIVLVALGLFGSDLIFDVLITAMLALISIMSWKVYNFPKIPVSTFNALVVKKHIFLNSKSLDFALASLGAGSAYVTFEFEDGVTHKLLVPSKHLDAIEEGDVVVIKTKKAHVISVTRTMPAENESIWL